MKKKKESSFILNKIYTLIEESVKGLRGRLTEIDLERYYHFKITTKKSDTDEFWTKTPEEDVQIKKG